MEHADSGAVSRRPHHISSIAHLFLGEGEAARTVSPVPATIRFAVAAPGGAAVSAFAAAGLALGSPGSSLLSEDARIRWSAGTYFSRPGADISIQAGRQDGLGNTWTLASPGRDPAPAIHWDHLGCLGEVEVSRLETAAAARTGVPEAASDCSGLVWCLREDEAGRLQTCYLLGRLAEILRPRRIEILLFPDAWSSAGRPGWLDDVRNVATLRYDDRNLTPVLRLAKDACGDLPLGIHQVTGADNLAANFEAVGEAGSLWRRLAQTLVSGPAGC